MLLKKQRSKDSSLSDGKQMEIEIENVYMQQYYLDLNLYFNIKEESFDVYTK